MKAHKPSINQNNEEVKTIVNKKSIDLNKDNRYLNIFFHSLTCICYFGTIIMVMNYYEYWKVKLPYKPEAYEIPKFSDFYISLLSMPFIICFKIMFGKLFTSFMYKNFLADKYKDPSKEEDFKMGEVYKKKLTMNLFKATYYTLIVLFCFFSCRDAPYFPYELGGSGDMINIFQNGVPGYIFFYKPNLFIYYYQISLGYVFVDMIWLLFVYETQSDFPIMLLHHSITISLVVFSYISNFSQIGIIVFFLHDFTDIFVYLTRIVINTGIKDRYKYAFCALFLFLYIYARIYVFGKLIYLVGVNLNDWNMYSIVLWYFKCILMVMHIYWVYEIILRFCCRSITDVGKVKKNK